MKSRAVKQLTPVLCLMIALFLHGCGGGGGDAMNAPPVRYDPGVPGPVTGVQAASGDEVVTLSWTPVYVAQEYNIYYAAAAADGGPPSTGWTKVNLSGGTSYPIWGLTDTVTYYFMVTAVDQDGEGMPSTPVASTPGPITQADLTGTWYFHTLVSGPSAKWERGTVVIDDDGNATFTEFLDSAHYNPVDNSTTTQALPPGATMTIQGDGGVAISATGAWAYFNGNMGSRKNMWVGTWTYSADGSKALTIFQKQRINSITGAALDDYSVWDIAGTSSGQNPDNPSLAGNGPTRFAYHALNSGSSLEWEYSNARVGQQAQFWPPPYPAFFPDGIADIKDIIYWDYSTPTYKTGPGYDFSWKITCFAIQPDGLVTEYDSFAPVTDGEHNVIFTGRMTDDKTVVVGVSTENEIPANQSSTGGIVTIPNQYYLRIIELNFIPTDQSLPTYTINDVAGNYKFHKIGAMQPSGGATQASWAYGTMEVTTSGVTTFPQYTDSNSSFSSQDTFTLAYYPDTGSDGHTWTTFANFVSPDTGPADAYARYYAPGGTPYFSVWTWWNPITNRTTSGVGDQLVPMSTHYFNEHGTLSYNRDMFVLTRTDSLGYSMIVGLK